MDEHINIGKDVRGGNIAKRDWLHVEGDNSVVCENASSVFRIEYSFLSILCRIQVMRRLLQPWAKVGCASTVYPWCQTKGIIIACYVRVCDPASLMLHNNNRCMNAYGYPTLSLSLSCFSYSYQDQSY